MLSYLLISSKPLMQREKLFTSSIVLSFLVILLSLFTSGCMGMARENVDFIKCCRIKPNSSGRISAEEIKQVEEEKKEVYQRAMSYVESHKELSQVTVFALAQGKVINGMTKEQVILVLGQPENIINSDKEHEIWWYRVSLAWFLDAYIHPLSWPRYIIHPSYLFDPKARDEIYFNGDTVSSLKVYAFSGYPF